MHNKCHLEITTLLIEGYNDSEDEVSKLCKWIADLNPNIPLHLSRYFPSYKFEAPATSLERMNLCRDIAKQYLNYVYIGNVQEADKNTYCPKCGKLLIRRTLFDTEVLLNAKNCPVCGYDINITL